MRNRNRNDNSRWTNENYNRDDRDMDSFAQDYNPRPQNARDDVYRDDVYAGHEGPYGSNSDHGYNNRSYPEDLDHEAREARQWKNRNYATQSRSANARNWDAPRPGSDRAGNLAAERMAERTAGTHGPSYRSSSTYRPSNFRSNNDDPQYFTGAHSNQVWEDDRNLSDSSVTHDHHDTDYFAWRDAELNRHDSAYGDWRRTQAQSYDTTYREWRKARQDKFASEFTDWRTTQTNQTTSDAPKLDTVSPKTNTTK